MLLDTSAKGLYVIAPTPFYNDGVVDMESVDRMTDFFLDSGAQGLTVLGQLGEAAKLDHAESVSIVSRVVQRAQGRPVVVGVTAPGFAAMRALARESIERSAAGVMIALPASLRTDAQIVTYYRHAVEAIGDDVPFVLQDYPLVFSVVMAPEVIKTIVNELPSCVMVKHEDWPGLDKISTLRKYEQDQSMRRTAILCGNNGMFLDYEMERGADGAMTGYCFPDALVSIIDYFAAGQREQAHDLFDAHLPLMRYEQQPGIGLAVRKYVLMRRGVIASAALRRPGPMLSTVVRTEVDHLLTRLARADRRAAISA